MIGSWRNQKKMMHQEAPSFDRESRNWERKNSNPGRLFPRAIIVFLPIAAYWMSGRSLNVGQSNTTGKRGRTGGARYSHRKETPWEHPHQTKARGEEAWQGHTEQTPPPNFLQLFCSEKKGIHQKAKCQPDRGIALVCQVLLFQISQMHPFIMVSRWQQPHP